MAAKRETTEHHKTKEETQLLLKRLDHFSRVAAFRELTAWLAHELNQPLAAILGNSRAALRLLEEGTVDLNELREILNDIVVDNQRAVEVIRSVRSLLKKGVAESQPLLLNDLIEEMLPIVQNDLPVGNISIDLDLNPSLPAITGDRIQLQQVILSLVANALEAMSASERTGKLIIRTRQYSEEVIADIVDSGTGIPRNKLNRIFDPFVTTKTDGLGMGLFLSRSIVIGHNGRLWAENNDDGGATFHLALPIEDNRRLISKVNTDQSSLGDTGHHSRGLTILIADDGESFRRAVSSILAELPELEFLAEASNGEEAIKKAALLSPDLILLDVGLPIINGMETAVRMHIVAPNAKMLFLTQHDSPDFVRAALRAGALGYVLKLDAGNELLQAVKAVLRGGQYISASVRREP